MVILGFEIRDFKLLLNFFKMSLRDRFLGSKLGMVWAFASPVMMLSIFTFVFGFVFKSKLPGAETTLAYVIWLISGYGPWLAISESLTSGTTSVVANNSMVKNLAFKTELLAISGGLMGLVPLLVSCLFLVGLIVADGRIPSLSWLYILLIIPLQFLFVTGIALVLSASNVFVRDTALVLPNILLLVLFFSPIFYPITSFPEPLLTLSKLNPFYVLSESYRQPLLFNNVPELWTFVYLLILSIGSFVGGLWVFRRLKGYFDSCM